MDTSDNESIYPSVNIDTKDYLFKINDIIKDEKNVLFFYFARKHIFPNPSYFKEEGLKRSMEEKHSIINIEYDEKINLSYIVPKYINKITNPPKYLIIWDDNLFKFAQKNWYDFLEKYPYVKLITFKNTNLNINHDRIIKIEIDLNKIAEESMNLLKKYVNKETVLISKINIKYKIY